jgi:hypothetical protein
MTAIITIGLILIGAALGAGVAWYGMVGRARARGRMLAIVAGSALAGALLFNFAAPAVTDAWATRAARNRLLAIPAYPVIERYEPVVFERLVAQYARVVRGETSQDGYTHVMNAELGTIATKHIAHASDAALLALMRDMLARLQVLRARAPDECYRYLFPKAAGPPDLARWFDRESQGRTLGLIADVVRTSSENPVAVPSRERVQGLLGPLIDDMYAQFGENTALLSRAEERGVDRKSVCAIATTLYEKVMRLPPADAAAVIRSMTQL